MHKMVFHDYCQSKMCELFPDFHTHKQSSYCCWISLGSWFEGHKKKWKRYTFERDTPFYSLGTSNDKTTLTVQDTWGSITQHMYSSSFLHDMSTKIKVFIKSNNRYKTPENNSGLFPLRSLIIIQNSCHQHMTFHIIHR